LQINSEQIAADNDVITIDSRYKPINALFNDTIADHDVYRLATARKVTDDKRHTTVRRQIVTEDAPHHKRDR